MSAGEIIIAALAIIGGAWLLSRWLGRERRRPATLPWGDVIELPKDAKAARRKTGGEGLARAGGQFRTGDRPSHGHHGKQL